MTSKDILAEVSTLGRLIQLLEPDVTDDDLITAHRALEQGELIGQRLIKMRVVTEALVDKAVELQRRIREEKDVAVVIDLLDELKAQNAAARARGAFAVNAPITDVGEPR